MNSASRVKRILVLGDSTALPRLEVPYHKTWCFHLKSKNTNYDIIDRSDRGASTAKLVTAGGGGVDTLELYLPDIVIIQMGVTESAPRLFKKSGFEYYLLNNIIPRRYRYRYANFIKKRRVRAPEKADSSPETFRANLFQYCTRADKLNTSIIFLPIAPPSNMLIAKSPHFPESIRKYNGILRDIAGEFKRVYYLDPFINIEKMEEYWLDEIHFNDRMHLIIAEHLDSMIHEQLT